MAAAETDANVALETDVVAGRELEGVETGHQDLSLRVQGPFAKDARVGGTAVLIRHQVGVVTVRHGVAATGETSVDARRRNFYLEHESVANDGAANFLAGG